MTGIDKRSDRRELLATDAADLSTGVAIQARAASTRLPDELRSDCERCAGLCCVVPPYYALQGFGFDKPANERCRYLTSANRCAIHSDLESRGFPGCVAFDCYGAGQRLTALLGGAVPEDGELPAGRLSQMYSTIVVLHRLMALLYLAAAGLEAGNEVAREKLDARRMKLDSLCASVETLASRIDVARIEGETLALVRETVGVGRAADARDS